MGRCDRGAPSRPAPTARGDRARPQHPGASTTRSAAILAERGAKPIPLAEVTSLVTGAAGLRLAGDAVLDLWQRDDASEAATAPRPGRSCSRAPS